MQFSPGLIVCSASKDPSLCFPDPQERALAIAQPGMATISRGNNSAAQWEHPGGGPGSGDHFEVQSSHRSAVAQQTQWLARPIPVLVLPCSEG